MALTLKQERFVIAYLGEARGNATEAARLAAYSDPDSSAKQCLKIPAIRARIQEDLEARALTKEAVLAELSDVGMAEWKHFIQVKTDADGTVIDAKIVLGDKVKALELLGKYHKLFTDRAEVQGDVTLRRYVGVDVDEV